MTRDHDDPQEVTCMGLLWLQEEQRRQRKRELNYYFLGIATACAVIGLVVMFVVQLTGGIAEVCS